MHTSKLNKSLTLIVIFQCCLVRWCKLEIHTFGRPSGIHTGYKQERIQRELNMTHIDFATLNSHVTVLFKIYQTKEQIFVWENRKILNSYIFPWHLSLYIRCAFFQVRKMLVKIWFVRKSYLSKFVKTMLKFVEFVKS